MSLARKAASLKWPLLLWWVLAGTAGFSAGALVEAVLGRSSGMLVVVHVSVGGTAAAALQWLALRRYVARTGLWVGTGVAGGAATGAIGVAVGVGAGVTTAVFESFTAGLAEGVRAGIAAGTDAAGVAAAVVFGAAVGVLQWLVLRQQAGGAGWWVPASAAGWVVGGLSAGITDSPAGWTVLGAVYGAITGCVLVWLLRQRVAAA